MEKQGPGEYQKLHDETFEPKPSLGELGIEKMQVQCERIKKPGTEAGQ